jgi:hypothetical protein
MPVQQREENERGKEEVDYALNGQVFPIRISPTIQAFGFNMPKAFCFFL